MCKRSLFLKLILPSMLLVLWISGSSLAAGDLVNDVEIDVQHLEFYHFEKDSLEPLYTKIPILIYHHFAPRWLGSNYYFTITTKIHDFEKQMRYLAEEGYNTITIAELYALMTSGKPIPDKSIILTFDDGYQSVYQYAYPILKKYNLKGTFFVIYNLVGQKASFYDPAHSSWEELQEMEASGVIDIQSHTFDLHYKDLDHVIKFMPKSLFGKAALVMGSDEVRRERILNDTRQAIAISQEKLGKTPVAVAIPFGIYDDLAIQVLQESAYSVILKTYIGAKKEAYIKLDELDRMYVRGYHGLRKFKRLLNPTKNSYIMPNDNINIGFLTRKSRGNLLFF